MANSTHSLLPLPPWVCSPVTLGRADFRATIPAHLLIPSTDWLSDSSPSRDSTFPAATSTWARPVPARPALVPDHWNVSLAVAAAVSCVDQGARALAAGPRMHVRWGELPSRALLGHAALEAAVGASRLPAGGRNGLALADTLADMLPSVLGAAAPAAEGDVLRIGLAVGDPARSGGALQSEALKKGNTA